MLICIVDSFLTHDANLVWYVLCPCVCVCLSHTSIVSKHVKLG